MFDTLKTVTDKAIEYRDTIGSGTAYYAQISSSSEPIINANPLLNEAIKVGVALLVGLLTKAIGNLFNKKTKASKK